VDTLEKRTALEAPRRRTTVGLAAAVAISACGGALGLVTGTLALGHELDQRLPFHSPVLGGVALALVVGLPATVLPLLVRRRDARADRAAVLAGALLLAWILVELAFIREFSFLQPVYGGVGLAFVAIGRRGTVRRSAV